MTHETGDRPGDRDALQAAVNDALEPLGPLDLDRVLRDVWFGVDHDPDARPPRDIVDGDRRNTDGCGSPETWER